MTTSHHRRRQRVRDLRTGIQILSMGVVIATGIRFALWVRGLEQGRLLGERPPGVEGFLPISALMSLRAWLLSGTPSRVHAAGLVLLVLILAMSFLLRKAFCAWICPVGTLAEWLGNLGRRLARRRARLPRRLDLPLRGVKYLLAAFFVYAVFIGMAPEPLFQFLDSPYNKVADVKMMHFFTRPAPLTVSVLAGLVVLSIAVPFSWCRYLCPYGALLGALSWFSPLKVTRVPRACTDCGLCTRACPALLPVATSLRVVSPECTGCLDCVAVCPAPGALDLTTPRPWRRVVRPVVFAALVAGLFFGGIGAAKMARFWQSSVPPQEMLQRLQELDDPRYDHLRGRIPADRPAD